MYDFNVNSIEFSILIIPPCCSTIRKEFIFHKSELDTLTKGSLLFQCTHCKDTYPYLSKLFSSWSILHDSIITHNQKSTKKKKNGFQFLYSINAESYSFLADLINMNNVRQLLSPPDSENYQVLFEYSLFVLNTSIYKIIEKFPSQPFLLSNIRCRCKSCGSHYKLNDIYDSKKKYLICKDCQNRMNYPFRNLHELNRSLKFFQNDLIACFQKRILIIPFNVIGFYNVISGGDIDIYKTL